MDTLTHFKQRAYVWMATQTISSTGPTCGRTPKTFSGTRPTCRRASKTISKTRLTRRHLIQTPHAIFFIVYMQLSSLSGAKLLFKASNATFVAKKRLVNYMSITITTSRIILGRMTGLPLTSQCSRLGSGRMQHTTVTFYYLCWRNKPSANHVSLLRK